MVIGARDAVSNLIAPNVQPQAQYLYDPITRRNVVTIAQIVPTMTTWLSAGAGGLVYPADIIYVPFGTTQTAYAGPFAFTATYVLGQWDSTEKRQYAQFYSTGGADSGNVLGEVVHWGGWGGKPTNHTPKNKTVTECHVKWRARFPTNYDYADEGIGMWEFGGAFSNINFAFIQVLRNGAAWELGTCNAGVARSQESGGTADGNWHDFHVRWTSTTVYLYVDDVLTITKTSNFPDAAMYPVVTTDGTGVIDVVDICIYWE